jgi:hypothetical protein
MEGFATASGSNVVDQRYSRSREDPIRKNDLARDELSHRQRTVI